MKTENRTSCELLDRDIDYILENTRSLWESFYKKRIFISGGTGFFGKWILKSLIRANNQYNLNIEVYLLTRNAESLEKSNSDLFNSNIIKVCNGDMNTFEFPNREIQYVIHAATETNNSYVKQEPLSLFESNINGTIRILDFANSCKTKNMLVLSSGAVYGNRFCEKMNNVSESYPGAPFPTDLNSVYGNGKRTIEILSTLYANKYGLNIKIARCFAFVGPYLPLKENYAIGNFIYDALIGKDITITGDGTPRRSYMYMSDLVIWLLNILVSGKSCYPYNVGSNYGISILDLAKTVSKVVNPHIKIKVLQKCSKQPNIEYYVPSIDRAEKELGLKVGIDLEDAINKTAKWYFPFVNNEINSDKISHNLK